MYVKSNDHAETPGDDGFRYSPIYYNELHSDLTAYALGFFPEEKIISEDLLKQMMPYWTKMHPTIKTKNKILP